MHPIALLFVMVIIPIIFFLIVWGATMAYRICVPEQARPFEREPVYIREQARRVGEPVSVGFKEIREDQQRFMRNSDTDYQYIRGMAGGGLPLAWIKDLQERCN